MTLKTGADFTWGTDATKIRNEGYPDRMGQILKILGEQP